MNFKKSLKPSLKIIKEWERFEKEFDKKFKIWNKRKPSMTVQTLKDGRLLIADCRGKKKKNIYLKNDEKHVFNACHAGLKDIWISKQLNLPLPKVNKVLKSLLKKKVILQVEDYYLSLALRAKTDLLKIPKAVESTKIYS